MVLIRIKNGRIEIPQNIPQKDKKFIERHLAGAYAKNKLFWKINVPPIKILLAYSRSEFDRFWGVKTPRWNSANAYKGRIEIFAPSVFDRCTTHKFSTQHYAETLAHEINHIFYQTFVGTYKPAWMGEGLAEAVGAPSNRRHGKIDHRYLFYFYKHKDLSGKIGYRYYRDSYIVIKNLLAKKNGKREIMKFLGEYRKHPNFQTYTQLIKRSHWFSKDSKLPRHPSEVFP